MHRSLDERCSKGPTAPAARVHPQDFGCTNFKSEEASAAGLRTLGTVQAGMEALQVGQAPGLAAAHAIAHEGVAGV